MRRGAARRVHAVQRGRRIAPHYRAGGAASGRWSWRCRADRILRHSTDTSREPLAPKAFLDQLAAAPPCADELGQLASVLEARSRVRASRIPGLAYVPMQLHGSYRIREILAAVGYHTESRRGPMRSGVLPLNDSKTELLFVTLDKPSGYHAEFVVVEIADEPRALEHEDVRWVTLSEMAHMPLAPADAAFVRWSCVHAPEDEFERLTVEAAKRNTQQKGDC